HLPGRCFDNWLVGMAERDSTKTRAIFDVLITIEVPNPTPLTARDHRGCQLGELIVPFCVGMASAGNEFVSPLCHGFAVVERCTAVSGLGRLGRAERSDGKGR